MATKRKQIPPTTKGKKSSNFNRFLANAKSNNSKSNTTSEDLSEVSISAAGIGESTFLSKNAKVQQQKITADGSVRLKEIFAKSIKPASSFDLSRRTGAISSSPLPLTEEEIAENNRRSRESISEDDADELEEQYRLLREETAEVTVTEPSPLFYEEPNLLQASSADMLSQLTDDFEVRQVDFESRMPSVLAINQTTFAPRSLNEFQGIVDTLSFKKILYNMQDLINLDPPTDELGTFSNLPYDLSAYRTEISRLINVINQIDSLQLSQVFREESSSGITLANTLISAMGYRELLYNSFADSIDLLPDTFFLDLLINHTFSSVLQIGMISNINQPAISDRAANNITLELGLYAKSYGFSTETFRVESSRYDRTKHLGIPFSIPFTLRSNSQSLGLYQSLANRRANSIFLPQFLGGETDIVQIARDINVSSTPVIGNSIVGSLNDRIQNLIKVASNEFDQVPVSHREKIRYAFDVVNREILRSTGDTPLLSRYNVTEETDSGVKTTDRIYRLRDSSIGQEYSKLEIDSENRIYKTDESDSESYAVRNTFLTKQEINPEYDTLQLESRKIKVLNRVSQNFKSDFKKSILDNLSGNSTQLESSVQNIQEAYDRLNYYFDSLNQISKFSSDSLINEKIQASISALEYSNEWLNDREYYISPDRPELLWQQKKGTVGFYQPASSVSPSAIDLAKAYSYDNRALSDISGGERGASLRRYFDMAAIDAFQQAWIFDNNGLKKSYALASIYFCLTDFVSRNDLGESSDYTRIRSALRERFSEPGSGIENSNSIRNIRSPSEDSLVNAIQTNTLIKSIDSAANLEKVSISEIRKIVGTDSDNTSTTNSVSSRFRIINDGETTVFDLSGTGDIIEIESKSVFPYTSFEELNQAITQNPSSFAFYISRLCRSYNQDTLNPFVITSKLFRKIVELNFEAFTNEDSTGESSTTFIGMSLEYLAAICTRIVIEQMLDMMSDSETGTLQPIMRSERSYNPESNSVTIQFAPTTKAQLGRFIERSISVRNSNVSNLTTDLRDSIDEAKNSLSNLRRVVNRLRNLNDYVQTAADQFNATNYPYLSAVSSFASSGDQNYSKLVRSISTGYNSNLQLIKNIDSSVQSEKLLPNNLTSTISFEDSISLAVHLSSWSYGSYRETYANYLRSSSRNRIITVGLPNSYLESIQEINLEAPLTFGRNVELVNKQVNNSLGNTFTFLDRLFRKIDVRLTRRDERIDSRYPTSQISLGFPIDCRIVEVSSRRNKVFLDDYTNNPDLVTARASNDRTILVDSVLQDFRIVMGSVDIATGQIIDRFEIPKETNIDNIPEPIQNLIVSFVFENFYSVFSGYNLSSENVLADSSCNIDAIPSNLRTAVIQEVQERFAISPNRIQTKFQANPVSLAGNQFDVLSQPIQFSNDELYDYAVAKAYSNYLSKPISFLRSIKARAYDFTFSIPIDVLLGSSENRTLRNSLPFTSTRQQFTFGADFDSENEISSNTRVDGTSRKVLDSRNRANDLFVGTFTVTVE